VVSLAPSPRDGDSGGSPRWEETHHATAIRSCLDTMHVSRESARQVEWLASELFREGYVLAPEKAVVVAGALFTGQVLMLRGTPGCGKTYLAECLNRVFNPTQPLLKVEGHEEVSVESLLYTQDRVGLELFLKNAPTSDDLGDGSWSRLCEDARRRFVHFGPLVQSIISGSEHRRRRVLLIDELDKFRGQSEALLLSFLNDYSVSVSHLNLYFAPEPGLEPIVLVTANESREIQHPTQRRCVVVPVVPPTILDENEILSLAVPNLPTHQRFFILLLALRIRSESLGLSKPLSISEVIDFARVVAHFEPDVLTPEFVESHAPYFAKNRKDQFLLGLKVRQCFDWAERQLRQTGGRADAALRLMRELNRRQLDARHKRDGDLTL
jgi:MoxR-like ATPase